MMQTDSRASDSWGMMPPPPADWASARVPPAHAPISNVTPARNNNSTRGGERLPRDPRTWSREHVAVWLLHMAARHQLSTAPVERFPMNGKALCLMSVEMFLQRVPLGGKLLYKDFQLRLGRAMYLSA